MKKIAIITLTGNNNYGNRLQNYALQKILELNHYQVETIWREKENNKPFIMKIYYVKEKIFLLLKSIQGKKNLFLLQKKRKNLFLNFQEKYMHLSRYESNGLISSQMNEEYDFFIAGSDQIWNYHYPSISSNDFLKFASYDKTISYAASFGVNEIPEKWIPFYKENLNHIKKISVREEVGKKIIKEIINKDCDVVLDPTLLLSKKQWLKITKKPNKLLPDKYLLVYFLGDIPIETQKTIHQIAKNQNLEIVDLKGLENKYFYESGPSEFVYLFSKANLIITDSFHGTAFSIIFEKDFYVFKRNYKVDMSSRIYSLLAKVDLINRLLTDSLEDITLIDYQKVNKKLYKECEKSMGFLKDALNDYDLQSYYK